MDMTRWQQQPDEPLEYAPDAPPWRPIGYSLQGLAYLRHQIICELGDGRMGWRWAKSHRDLLLVKAETGRR
jgi:hypothetical protein